MNEMNEQKMEKNPESLKGFLFGVDELNCFLKGLFEDLVNILASGR